MLSPSLAAMRCAYCIFPQILYDNNYAIIYERCEIVKVA